jgi:hypothetical protein
MSGEPLRINFPYTVRYLRPRHRRPSFDTIWVKNESILIKSANSDEAPAAFRIARTNGLEKRTFEVRSYGGSLWWPIYDGDNCLNVSTFIEAIKGGESAHLGLLDHNLQHYSSNRREDENDFFARMQLQIREIQNTTRATRLKLAEAGAENILFCDNAVYVNGGDPVFYYTFGDWRNQINTATIDIIHSIFRADFFEFPRSPRGYFEPKLEKAACQGLVFRIDEFDRIKTAVDSVELKLYALLVPKSSFQGRCVQIRARFA